MRFSRLRLNGFKSFVDPTDLIIADGLTGVVGPNGCGKSNLLEALRWVMGENRPTAMRGGGMEDVIFAGAATRPARNFAEVSLVIDNTERLAPAGFNDNDMLEIVRRITRDAGSAYKVGAKDVRARDVQMLFADASTGAHSPALVRQGQISELINAKPKARRRILEEAAGISGLYQRRHEAELKLKGAEQNLSRVDDVLEQLASQLASLARQAKQAARYREIAEALREAEGLLLYRRWREADLALAGARDVLKDRSVAAAAAEREAISAGTAREAAEAGLPPVREEAAIAAALVQRLEVERGTLEAEAERAEAARVALEGRVAQLGRDIEREGGLNRDAEETIARLEEEAKALEAESAGDAARQAEAEAAAREAAEVLASREAALAEATEDAARLAARHQSAERLVEETGKVLARARSEAARAAETVEAAEAALGQSAGEAEAAEAAEAEAVQTAEAAEAALVAAEDARAAVQGREAEARAARSSSDGEAKALEAETAALERLVAREAGDGDQLIDRVSVSDGYEKALGAALADDLRAPLVAEEGSGWAALAAYKSVSDLPGGAAPLADFVEAPGVLDRRLALIGVVGRAEGAALQAALAPGQRLVSREGDLWRWDGFRANAEDAPSEAALRLEQMNRLAALREELAAARQRAEVARVAHEALGAELSEAVAADGAARTARKAADAAVAEAQRRQSRAAADRDLAQGRLESAKLAVVRHEDEALAAEARLKEAEAGLAEVGDPSAAKAELEDVRVTVEAARMTMMARRSAFDELRREAEARAGRRRAIEKDLGGWRQRLENAAGRMAELVSRKATSEEELVEVSALPSQVAERIAALASGSEEAGTRKRTADEALVKAETAAREADVALRAAERAASEAREERARAEAHATSAEEAVEAAALRIEEALEVTPERLLEALGADPDKMPGAEEIEVRVATLKRQRDALGAVNLRAEEDAKEVREEHETLAKEKQDLEAAIAALRTGISSLNREGRERLLTAFEEVNRSFGMLFKHLFGGGEARLELVESEDPLDAGLEILCQPPGKKLSTLSLLSGGEQTLTALALIFAVFLANPAPICVLDEVDAPLDDANVTRFCDLLDEMTRRTNTRFLIITHHAVTMARMDRLFGVTMGEQGVSQLVSVDLKRAETMVA
ncbi:chromosome segregation protein SMC [Aestuariibius sp. 2305UL40-4]|uniref:chromosome segregation protein SMC n=1 Tax=Aestuariibius violaceus TaxID=3234132 RepID=UPI00345EFBDC